MDQRDMWRRIGQARVARLATIDPNGRPHLVPLVFAVAESRIYSAVDHKPKRSKALKRLENIAENPAVSLLIDEYDDDWSQLWWIRLDGTAKVVETGPEWERAVTHLADKYPQYRGHPPDGAVVAVSIDRIVGWDAGDAS